MFHAARALRRALTGAFAGTVAATVFVLLDVLGRARWGAAGRAAHVAAAGGLFIALGASVMAAVALVVSASSAVRRTVYDARRTLLAPEARKASLSRWRDDVRRLLRPSEWSLLWRTSGASSTPDWGLRGKVVVERRSSRFTDWAYALIVGGFVAVALNDVIIRALSRIRPVLPVVGFFGVVAATLLWRALAERVRPRGAWFVGFVVLSAMLSVVLLLLDARILRGRHLGMHLAVELVAFFLLAGTISLVTSRSYIVHRASVVVGAGALVWAALLLGTPTVRTEHIASLRHLAADTSTVGTIYTRTLSILGRADRPLASALQVERWRRGERETPKQRASVAELHASCRDCNIVVYFVDTLRADTADDPNIMPAMSAFSRSSIRFPSAYSSASDTLRALSSMLVGRYEGSSDDPNASVLRRVRSAGIDNALFIPASAHDYLSTQLNEFRFDEVVTFADHDPAVAVWGYGADTPTGDDVTRAALSWMGERRDRRFFTWLYNFDLHGWRQLKDEHVGPVHDEAKFPDRRYYAVASMVDRSFRALIEGLDAQGLSDRTIVMLVSDHGEALGYRGFWTHSTFLWQSLVHVPLAVRIPGLEAKEVAPHASVVDLAPTISRFVDPSTDVGGYHGVDLLRFYADPETERALPLLLHASSEGRPTLYGLVSDGRKLVMPSAGGRPLLHDLTEKDPDETDLVTLEPECAEILLDQLASSPIVTLP